MKYEILNLKATDYIGDSLSSVNLNYKVLETWTNNITFSSVNLYNPLLNFYNFYGDFWKSTINYATSINAVNRLNSFATNVETNSAKWIKPVTFFYPTIKIYNSSTLNVDLNQAFTWFKSVYPVLTTSTAKPNFAENTKAFLYCMFYEESVKINQNRTITGTTEYGSATRNCTTSNRSGVVGCYVIWRNNVQCYSTDVCPMFNYVEGRGAYTTLFGRFTRGGNVTCQRTFTASCSYENGAKSINRSLILNVNNYFKDRSEYDRVYCLQLTVKNCDWVLERII